VRDRILASNVADLSAGSFMAFRAGDWVEIRSKEEILKSLDKRGQLDGLPFMPQMFQYCGQRLQVYKSAPKTCNTINGTGGCRLSEAIHLEVRCDGKAHGICQAACLIFWKEAWIKPVGNVGHFGELLSPDRMERNSLANSGDACTEEDVWRATRADDHCPSNDPTYSCQATQLLYFTAPLPWSDVRQYLRDYTSGNVSMRRMLCGFIYATYYCFSQPTRRNRLWGAALRRLYDWAQALWRGITYPRRTGIVPAGQPNPTASETLQPGDVVRVKSYEEILATIDGQNKNRGLFFDAELVPYCGGQYRVRSRVTGFIDEKTGKMSTLKTPAVILENVWCQSRYSTCRVFCPRSIYSWWREVWLEKLTERSGSGECGATIADQAAATSAQARYLETGVQGSVIIGQLAPGSQQLTNPTHDGYTRRSVDACRRSIPRFLVTVDAEEDNGWAAMPSITTRNAAFLPRFQRLCESFGLKPTYLTNYPMATSDDFIDFGRDLVARGAGEIGMHLHAWNTPPIVPITDNDARHHTYLIDYRLDVMRQKIVRMTACLADTFDVPILSHRAGRWGFDSRYAGLLLEEGYRVDCSVTPFMSWRRHGGAPGGKGGTDYTEYPELPYFLDAQDPSRAGSSGLLELPVTILPNWTTIDRPRKARIAGAIAAWLG
jgi:hypothetical protein